MRNSLKIGAIGGIPIRVHWSFPLLIALVVAASFGGSTSAIVAEVVLVVVLFASVTVHELSHCAVARKYGLRVEGITLLPLGGVSQIAGMTSTPRIERDIAIAGPLASLALALAFAAVAFATGSHMWPPALVTGNWFSRFAWMNGMLAAFNLLPALPMDGGRVLRAVLARRGNPVRATNIASGIATLLGAAMIAVGLVEADIILSLIGIFVIWGAASERRMAMVQASVRGIRVGDVMTYDPTSVLAQVTVEQLGPWLQSFPGRAVPIVDGENYVGIVAMEDLVKAPPLATVGEAADKQAPVLDASGPVYPAALEAFGLSGRLSLAVMSGGRVVGVLYRMALQAVLLQQQAAANGRANSTRAA